MRTVTTPAAQAAARGLDEELPALAATVAALSRHGATLADPRFWEGPKAHVFRARTWPEVEGALHALRTSLADLARGVGAVNRRIADAGT